MLKERIITVLDIASTKILCYIASIQEERIEILGVGYNISRGIRNGIISDLKAAKESIMQAVRKAEKQSGKTVRNVFLTLPSSSLISHRVYTTTIVSGHEINKKDLNRLLWQQSDKYTMQDLEVIHSLPYNYSLDGQRGIENPIGMYGDNLSAQFHNLSIPSNTLMNINKCIESCDLEVSDYLSSAYVSGLACLTEDELQLGTTFIEYGGGNTSISIFSNGRILYTDAIEIGGMHVTNDIAKGLCIDMQNAERIKVLYGTVNPHNVDHADVNDLHVMEEDIDGDTIDKNMLVDIIRARIEEINEIIKQKLASSNMEKYAGNKIVITGGASELIGLKELTSRMFLKRVRVASPLDKEIIANFNRYNSVANTTAIGLLLYIYNDIKENHQDMNQHDEGIVANIAQWLKNTFQ